MILKEIEMDLPFVCDDDISNEESIKLYESTWKSKRRQIQLNSRCMTSMIERLMQTINTENYWKIIIECVENINKSEGIYLPGILFVQVSFKIDSFFQMNNIEKKKYIINKVLEAVEYLSSKGYSELVEIKQICNVIGELNYVNEWLWKKPVRYKNKAVQIKVLHDVDKVNIYMVFNDGNKNEDILLVEEVPDEWVYSRHLGKLEWVAENEARLIAKDGKIFLGKFD